jgi:hypothetical protein
MSRPPSKRARAIRMIAKDNRIKEIMASPNERRRLFRVMLDGDAPSRNFKTPLV